MTISRSNIGREIKMAGKKKKRGGAIGRGMGIALKGGGAVTKPPLGSGGRFKALSNKLKKRGATNPGALAAWIGRKKYGPAKMAAMSKKGRKA